MATRGSVEAGKGHVTLGVDDNPLTKGLNAAAAKMQSFALKIAGIGAAVMAAGSAISAPLMASLNAYADYEQALADLRAAASPTAEEFARIKSTIEAISLSTGTGVVEVTQAFSELLKAGAQTDDVLGGLGLTAIRFARVSGIEMGETARILLGVMNVFSREAGMSAEMVADFMARADGASSTTLPLIAEAFATGGSALADYNQTLETTSVLIAILGQNLVEGANAGTALRVLFNRLATGNDNADAALRELGIGMEGLRDSSGQLLPAVEIIGRLQAALGRFGTADQDRLRNMLAGERGGRPLGILLREGTEGFNRMRAQMAESASVSERFAIITNTLKETLKRLWNQVSLIVIAVGEALAPAFRRIIDAIGPVLDLVQSWVGDNERLINIVDRVGTALTIAGAIIIGIGGAIYVASTAFSVLATLIANIGTVAGLGVLLVAARALGFSFGEWVGALSFIDDALDAIIDTIVSLWNAFADSPFGAFAADVAKVAIAMGALAGLLGAAVGYVAFISAQWLAIRWWEGVQILWGWFQKLWAIVSDFVVMAHQAFRSLYGPLIEFGGQLFSAISGSMSRTVAVFGEAFSNIAGEASLAFTFIQEAFSQGNWQAIWDIAKITASIAWNEISFALQATWNEWSDLLIDTFSYVWTALQAGFTIMWGAVKQIAFNGLAAIADGMAALGGPMADVLRSQAGVFRTQAIQAGTSAQAAVRDLRENAENDQLVNDYERFFRDRALGQDREAAFLDGNREMFDIANRLDAERQRRQADLDAIGLMEYEESVAARTNATAGAPVGTGTPTGSSTGTFSGAAAALNFGGDNLQSEVRRTNELLRENVDAVVRVEDAVREGRGGLRAT